jgi:hypothetical protein
LNFSVRKFERNKSNHFTVKKGRTDGFFDENKEVPL